jgi:hypothetical protein
MEKRGGSNWWSPRSAEGKGRGQADPQGKDFVRYSVFRDGLDEYIEDKFKKHLNRFHPKPRLSPP